RARIYITRLNTGMIERRRSSCGTVRPASNALSATRATLLGTHVCLEILQPVEGHLHLTRRAGGVKHHEMLPIGHHGVARGPGSGSWTAKLEECLWGGHLKRWSGHYRRGHQIRFQAQIEQFLAVRRPLRLVPSLQRNLPLATSRRER